MLVDEDHRGRTRQMGLGFSATAVQCALGYMSTFLRHTITHSEVNPFKCYTCERAFTLCGTTPLREQVIGNAKLLTLPSLLPGLGLCVLGNPCPSACSACATVPSRTHYRTLGGSIHELLLGTSKIVGFLSFSRHWPVLQAGSQGPGHKPSIASKSL